ANPTAHLSAGGGAVLAVDILFSTATANGTTRAYLAGGTTVLNAGSVAVAATDATAPPTHAALASGGILGGHGTPTPVPAYPNAGVQVTTTGTLDVEAVSTRAEGDATAKSFGGGGVHVGIPKAHVTTSPTV